MTKAYEWAKLAHGTQMYGNLPYICHLCDVAFGIECPTYEEFTAGLLHDVVEDTDKTVEDVDKEFGTKVAQIVFLLTKNKDLTYQENIEHIINSGNKSAMKVKLADNKANLSGDKSDISPEKAKSLDKRYRKSIKMLESALNIKEGT